MKTLLKKLLAIALLAFAASQANASLITVHTGYSTAAAQSSAAAYQSVVNAAVATPTAGYGTAVLPVFNNIQNSALFGSNNNIAFKFDVLFNVAAGQTGTWEFRAGVDFGNGAAVFLDGVALGFKSNDMWWNGSYGNSSQYFDYTALLGAGAHTLTIYGLEMCCDGSQQAQYRVAGSNIFTTFSSTDGLSVPEPSSLALLGLGMMLVAVRRKA